MGKPKLKVRLTGEAEPDSLVSARTVGLRERLVARLLGRKHRLTVLVPGNQVGSIEIIQPDDDLTVLANAVGVLKQPAGDCE
ncbi:hypothetical protein RQN30_03255 [Arcanobacterium hippocoleae]